MKHDKDISQLKRKIETDPDFINSKKYGHSLAKYEAKHPGGTPDNIIAVLLCMSIDEVEEIYNSAIKKMRSMFKADVI